MKQNLSTLAVALVGLALFTGFAWGQPWTPWRIAGLAIAIPSLVLFVIARLQLGSAFSMQAKASTLVTTGIYSRVRNPIYVFGALMIVGVIVWAHRPWWLLAFAVLIPMQIFRVRNEEQVLAEKFGDAYLEYKRKTWF
jgi:protein-S-isoprenylcysteine O-methyltransferase Ste14